MTYTEASSVFLADGEPQDISESYWVAVLERAGSFEVDALWAPFDRTERPDAARQLYRIVTEARQRASYWLAKPFEEHSAGTNRNSVLWRGQTRSWGNATSVRLRSLTGWSMYFDVQREREYVRYANVIDSMKDALFRIVDPDFVYVKEGRRTIRQVGERFVGLSENTDNYVAGLVRRMNQYVTEDEDVEVPPVSDLELVQCLIPGGRANRPGLRLAPSWITIHETANTGKGAGAAAHCNYIRSDAAASRPASWHVTVDDHSAYQHLPFDEVAWHAGDGSNGTGNRHSLAIELCVNSDGDWEATKRNAAVIVTRWMREFGIPVVRVVPHGRWNQNTACPARLRAGDWDGFIAMLGDVTPVPPEAPMLPPTKPEPNGKDNPYFPARLWIPETFLADIGKHDWMVTGWAVSEAFVESGRIVQYFERARLELQPDGSVTRGLVGREVLVQRYPERAA